MGRNAICAALTWNVATAIVPITWERVETMQSILTKYLPATNFKGSRIKAWTSGGAKAIIRSYDHALNGDDNHLTVARELANIMGWHGRYIEGSLGDRAGNVYVLEDDRGFTIAKKARAA